MIVELISITPNAEDVIEKAGRTCYQSEFRGDGKLIKSLIQSGHDSVLEHGYATFRISEVSRALTHQLVRHRIASYSQKSQRYVDENAFEYVIPESIYASQELTQEFKADMNVINQMYVKWRDKGIKKEDARFVLPNACTTEIVMSANFREYRNIIKLRCSKHAQWEIRKLFNVILQQLSDVCPNVFGDLTNG